ncbi:MAG: NAD-dependent epimerase/dehydratase family protein [Bacteroidetes bacterium SB0662_bin_6]|nr:NAD-dependent epimerase/dehydratase family protein [Bacteroidetes bacterium SB0668_bin_1]MYE04337.1 NAD-dependent epimerase/dehydratase family protein [Bacteroidetes bacterium SB0662_bin_6]
MSMTLVTGATGFVGAVLTRRLVLDGVPVRVFRRAGSKLDLLGETAQKVEHALGDITDDLALQKAMQGVEYVYHVAGNIGFGSSRVRNRLMSVNVDGTAAVVNAALAGGVRRLVHASSVAALGRSNRPDDVLDENAQWQRSKSNSTYGYSKYLAELEVKRGIAEGLDAVMVNPSLIFGLGRKGENTRRIVDQIRRKRIVMFPAGVTSVVDVLDVADGMVRAMQYGEAGERFVLAAHNLSWEELFRQLAQACGAAPPTIRLAPAAAILVAYSSEAVAFLTRTEPLLPRANARFMSAVNRYDNTFACEKLGWRPRPFEETVRRIADAL